MKYTNALVRTHVIFPKNLLEELDKIVGKHGRSKFITDAARSKLNSHLLAKSAEKAAGILKNIEIPGWETNKTSYEWVRKLRKENDKRLK